MPMRLKFLFSIFLLTFTYVVQSQNCPGYSNTVTSEATACSNQAFYFVVENTSCPGTITFDIDADYGGVWGFEIDWEITSNLTSNVIASGTGTSFGTYSATIGPINVAAEGQIFTLTVYDLAGDGFDSGGYIDIIQGGNTIVSVSGNFGSQVANIFGPTIQISQATISITTPSGVVTESIPNCKDFKTELVLQNTNFCNTTVINLPWEIRCNVTNALLSSGSYPVTVYPTIPSSSADLVVISWNNTSCSWTITPQNDCDNTDIDNIFTIYPDPASVSANGCIIQNQDFEIDYTAPAGRPSCCLTGGPLSPINYNQNYTTSDVSVASSPFGGVNNSAYFQIPASTQGGDADNLTLTVDMTGYTFPDPPGIGTDNSYWVTIYLNGNPVYDVQYLGTVTNLNIVLDETDLAGYDENSVIEVYIYPNSFSNIPPTTYTTFVPNTTPSNEGEWTANNFTVSLNVDFEDSVGTSVNCTFSTGAISYSCNGSALDTIYLNVCDSVAINGNWYYDSQLVKDTLFGGSVNGCDSITTYNITLNYSTETFANTTSCNPSDAGTTVYGPFTNTNGCDSTHTITITFDTDTILIYGIFCVGDTFTPPSTSSQYTTNGIYWDTVWTSPTCVDYILRTEITFNNPPANPFNWPEDSAICEGDTIILGPYPYLAPFENITWDDGSNATTRTITTSGTYWAVFDHPVVACAPLTDTINVTVLPPSIAPTVDTVGCDSVNIEGIWHTSSASVNDTLFGMASNGCDSIITYNIVVNYPDSTFSTATSCNPTDTGFATTSHLNANGCDSTHTIYTSLLASSFSNVDTTACDSIFITGNWYFNSTSFNDTLYGGAANGCDSIITYNITINSSTIIPPSSTEFNTGTNGAGGTLPGGSTDLLWQVSTTTLNGTYNPAIVMSSTPAVYYTSPWPDATWVSLNNDGSHAVDQDFFYRADFELPCEDCLVNNFCLNLDIFCDNTITEIYVNGIPQSPYGTFTPGTGGFSDASILSLSFCNDWAAGQNSIIFEVFSTPGYTGFLAQSSINPPPPSQIDSLFTTICNNQDYDFNGTLLNTQGVYNDTLQDVNGCDSILVLTLTVNPTDSTFEALTSCNPTDTGTILYGPFANANGCDSTHTITTTLIPTAFNIVNANGCDSLNIIGNWYYNSTSFNDTLFGGATNGCDSIVTYNLTINNTVYTYDTINACDSLFFNGTWYYQEDTVVEVNNTTTCDSIHTTIIDITNSPLSFSEMNLDGNAYQMDGNTFSLTEAINNDYGSIWFTNAIDLTQDFNLNFELFFGCDDAGADGLVFVLQQNNTNLGVAGGGMGYGGIIPSLGVEFDTYENTTSSDLAEDHTALVQNGNTIHTNADNLVGPIQASATSANIEDCAYHDVRVIWNAATQTFEVYFDGVLRITYTGDIVNNIFGGNPTVYWGVTAATGGSFNDHRVRVKRLDYIALEDDTICSGDTINITAPLSGLSYSWTPTNSIDNPTSQSPNFYPTTTTEYILELISGAGCSSFDTMTIVVNPVDSTFETLTSCNPADTGYVTTPYFNQYGCDSSHTVYTQLLPTAFDTVDITACDSTNVLSTWYYTNTTFNDTLFTQAANGCDSIVTYQIVINNSIETFDTIVACDSANINGLWYFASQDVPFNGNTVNGCDSTHNVNLTIHYSAQTSEVVVECDSAQINGTWYFTTQNIPFNSNTANGCDSVHTVNLTIHNAIQTTENIVACDSAQVYGTWYFASQDVPFNSSTVNGCDSAHTINITINNSTSSTDNITACDTYTWINGNTYTASNNSDTYIIMNSVGCDSTVTLNLTINYSVNTSDTVYTCFESNVGENISSVTLSNGCDSTHTNTVLLYSINYNVIPNEVTVNSGTTVPYYINNDNGNISFGWIASDGTACQSNCTEYTVSPTELVTYYYFTLTDDTTGCIVSDTLRVNVEFNSAFNVPNVFTPNGDGQNDIFRCYGEDIVDYQLEIFDRWGGRMFITNVLTEGWDGVFNSLPVESGIYMAVIRAAGADGQKYEIVQKIKLVR